MTQVGCPVCESPACRRMREGFNPLFNCDVCGYYEVSGSAMHSVLHPSATYLTPIQRAVLSHRIRRTNDAGQNPPLITTYDVDDVMQNGSLPNPAEQASNIIRFVGDRVAKTGNVLDDFQPSFHASIGSPNRGFALRLAKQLVGQGYLTLLHSGHSASPDEVVNIDLTLGGWERFHDEQRGRTSGNYGFIALKFGDETLDAFLKETIKPASASLGYKLFDMRDVSKAGVIDNLIRAQIRDAAFVLVDLTHDNSGAYWEAGYAEGLNKPVLYLCEKSKFQEASTHFDTNHCTTVVWSPEEPEDFAENLTATLRRSLGLFG